MQHYCTNCSNGLRLKDEIFVFIVRLLESFTWIIEIIVNYWLLFFDKEHEKVEEEEKT